MKKALGLVETIGLSNTILVADTMVKTANVQIINIENTKGLGYMTIKILGDVGAVYAAVNSGRKIAIENNSFVATKVIPRPSDYIEETFCQSEKEKIKPRSKDKKDIKEKKISKAMTNIDSKNKISENVNIVENKEKIDKEKVDIKNKEVRLEEKKVNVEEKKIDIQDKKVGLEEDKINSEIEEEKINKENLNIDNSGLEEKKAEKSSRKKKELKKDNS